MTGPSGSTGGDRWGDELEDAVAAGAGRPGLADRGAARDFAGRVPPGYRDQTTPAQAALDLVQLEALVAGPGRPRLAVRPGPQGVPDTLRLRRYGAEGVELSGFLPLIESFGLVVIEAVPYRLKGGPGREPAAHIDDFGLRLNHDPQGVVRNFDHDVDGRRLVAAVEAALRGDTDVDSLNRLVTAAGMDWRQVMVLRAYRRYRHQAGGGWTDPQLDDPLVLQPAIAASLLRYFETRFDPDRSDREAAARQARSSAIDALSGVASLPQDQVLRGYVALIDATLRTSYHLRDGAGRPRPTLTLKLDSSRVPELVRPRPRVETFVHAPRVEGVHLRAGLVARGGIRWSDRPDDFRTEVLGLAEAQVKKNAIIVPTGAKGGFVCRRPVYGAGSANGGDAGGVATVTPAASPAEVAAGYEAFIRALLDVTDNIVDGQVRSPEGVVALDGEDPYLVVAADRGTAELSDLANALSAEYGYWMGDAFASGGSHGYDHKAMGITARGTWVAVRRHFHQLGIDVQRESVRVVGVGDMSGDVFGNGMLQSEAIELVAAFDHRHIFLDPTPDAAIGFAERRRLAALARSSWDDYERPLLSPGGGVWPRHLKSIPLLPAAVAALGLDPATEALSPPELISAILAAPVDLIFFGGIGTFIKAPTEPDVDVGDHANDRVRITADQVRARVVAEGGNLAVTQQARIRYSRRGGRINADFIDNAAGVATSDREVNLKILLALAIKAGHLELDQRDVVLSGVQSDIAGEVLRQVDHSVAALNRAVPASARDLDAYAALLEHLERSGRIDRQVESLPTFEELASRRRAGAGLIRPELAVLLAYAKSDLVAAIEASGLVSEPALEESVRAYFPPAVADRFGDLVTRHRLYQQLLATDLAGEMVDQMGIVWAHETAAELGRDVAEVAAAFWAARQVLDAGPAWSQIEVLASSGLDADAEAELHRSVTEAEGYLARCYLTRPGRLDVGDTIATDRPVALALRHSPHPLAGRDVVEADLLASGVPSEVAVGYATTAALARIADVGRVARQSGWSPEAVLRAAAAVDRSTGLDRLDAGLRGVAVNGRWASWQAHALRDDIVNLRRRAVEDLTALALGTVDGERAEAESVVREWAAARASGLAEMSHLLDAFGAAESEKLTVASLALRCLSRVLNPEAQHRQEPGR